MPGDLHLPHVDVHAYFTQDQLDRASSFDRFLEIDGALAQIAIVIALWVYARNYERFVGESAAGRIGTGLLLGMLAFAFVWLAQLPFGLAALSWARSHDVSHVGDVEWAFASWIQLGVRFVFICAAIAIVMALARPFRRTWWVFVAPIFTGLVLLFAFLAPYLTPELRDLRRQDLRVAAASLARIEGVPRARVSVLRVHNVTSAPNAEAMGIGSSKRVVLWETLLEPPFTDREIRPVIAHELAHLKRDHALKSVGLYALFAFPLAFLIALATRRRGGMFEPGAVPLAILVFTVLGLITTPLRNGFERRYEREADWIALGATRDPAGQRSAMRLLATTTLSVPNPPLIEQLFTDSHPSILERIELTKAWEARNRR